MFITGENGCVKLRRATGNSVKSLVRPEDVNTLINRFSFEGAEDNLLIGDRIEISTKDPRGLLFIDPSWWSDSTRHHSAMVYAHMNAAGGIRMFRSFTEALNNDKRSAGLVTDFTGEPIEVLVDVRDTGHHPLAGVTGFTFNTDRAAVDVTSLGDLFTEQYSAGNITGSGTIDCLFQVERQRCSADSTQDMELSLLLPQIILRTELGGQFAAILQLYDDGTGKPVFYEVDAVTTRTGVTVRPGGLIEVAMDFVTTGEYRLRVGEPSGYILKEDYDRIMREQDIDFLLTEPTD